MTNLVQVYPKSHLYFNRFLPQNGRMKVNEDGKDHGSGWRMTSDGGVPLTSSLGWESEIEQTCFHNRLLTCIVYHFTMPFQSPLLH